MRQTPELEAVLSALTQYPDGVSFDQIDRALKSSTPAISMPRRTLQRRLSSLVEANSIRSEGERRGTRYYLPENKENLSTSAVTKLAKQADMAPEQKPAFRSASTPFSENITFNLTDEYNPNQIKDFPMAFRNRLAHGQMVTSEIELLNYLALILQPGISLLSPLEVRSFTHNVRSESREIDGIVELALPNESAAYKFIVDLRVQSTPSAVKTAVARLKSSLRDDEYPLIIVPYLSPERLNDLQSLGVSGVDLCGNGIVRVPERLFVYRTGQPNLYPETRPLANPYKGRSALVGRMLLTQRRWSSLNELTGAIESAGADISLAQVSKAVQAMADDLIVLKSAGTISLREPLQLLERLGRNWEPAQCRKQPLRLTSNKNWSAMLSPDPTLKWAVTGGGGAVKRYVTFSQGGPIQIAVSDLDWAMKLVSGTPEPIPNFADITLVETGEPGFFFQNEIDESKIRWASPIQTWLELQAGDARQLEAANDLRKLILKN